MHAAHAPKPVRNPRCLPRLPSAHVMRIALPPRHRSSLRQSGPTRSRAPTSPRLGSRPRASDAAPGLSTRTMPMARFSEPDNGPTTSATLRRTGTRRGSWSLVRSRGDVSPRGAFAGALPFRDSRGDEPLSRRSPKRASRADRPNRDEVPCLLGLGVPRSPRTAHLHVARMSARRAEPFELRPAHPMPDPRGPSISRSPVPHLPAKADAFSRRPRCVRPPLGSPVRGNCSPRPFEWASRPRDPRRLQSRRACVPLRPGVPVPL